MCRLGFDRPDPPAARPASFLGALADTVGVRSVPRGIRAPTGPPGRNSRRPGWARAAPCCHRPLECGRVSSTGRIAHSMTPRRRGRPWPEICADEESHGWTPCRLAVRLIGTRLTPIASTGCERSTRPTVYRVEDNGSLAVQSYTVEASDDLSLPAGESAVRIPAGPVETLTRAVSH